eukprot:361318-Chlamydomonas_euryale.AAC.1
MPTLGRSYARVPTPTLGRASTRASTSALGRAPTHASTPGCAGCGRPRSAAAAAASALTLRRRMTPAPTLGRRPMCGQRDTHLRPAVSVIYEVSPESGCECVGGWMMDLAPTLQACSAHYNAKQTA